MASWELCSAGADFVGWYEAPFPFGKTEFTLKIVTVDQDGSFTGTGSDKQGEFTVAGTLASDDVVFEKEYKDGSHKGIKYVGRVERNCVAGDYRFNYRKMFINMDICEKFWMEKI